MSNRLLLAIWVVSIFLTLRTGVVSGAELADHLPASAKLFIEIGDPVVLEQRLRSLQSFRFLQEADSGTFGEQTLLRYGNILRRTEEYFGISWPSLRDIGKGALGLALIDDESLDTSGWLLIHETSFATDRHGDDFLDQLANNLHNRGHQSIRNEALANGMRIYSVGSRLIAHAIWDNRFYASGNARLLSKHLSYLKEKQASLTQLPAFQTWQVMSSATRNDRSPDVRCFAVPFQALAAASRLRNAPQTSTNKAIDWLAAFDRQGFHNIPGLAGNLWLATSEHDMSYEVHFHGPLEQSKALQLLQFPTPLSFSKELPFAADLTSIGQLSWNLTAALQGYGFLFDDVYADGEQGVFQELLDSLRDDQDGPRIDIRKTVMPQLGSAVDIAKREAPEAPGTQRTQLWLLRTTTDLTSTAERLFEDDPDARRLTIAGSPAWEIVPRPRKRGRGNSNRLLGFSTVATARDTVWLGTDLTILRPSLESSPAKSFTADAGYQQIRNLLRLEAVTELIGWQIHRAEQQARLHANLWDIINRFDSESPVPFPTPPSTTVFQSQLGPGGWSARKTSVGWMVTGFIVPRKES